MSEEPRIVTTEEEMQRISRKSFLWAGASLLGAGGVYWWLNGRGLQGGKPWPFRRAFQANETLARSFGQGSARTFTEKDLSNDPRTNGDVGIADTEPEDWKLEFHIGEAKQSFTLDEVKAMPATEMTCELNCIEGWTRVIHWKGVRVSDILAKLGIAAKDLPAYVGLESPFAVTTAGPEQYYVGLDKESFLHPQSIFAYEMNGAPLTVAHGAPLRHVLPIKYGYKQLKAVRLVTFSDERPRDYWAERGYDWYGGF